LPSIAGRRVKTFEPPKVLTILPLPGIHALPGIRASSHKDVVNADNAGAVLGLNIKRRPYSPIPSLA